MYDGLSSTYYSDEEKAFELLAVIIGKMNLMQEEKVLIIHVHVHIRGAQKNQKLKFQLARTIFPLCIP